MHIKMVNEILDYTQNLGSSEDIITGLFAAAIGNCPVFTHKLFNQLGIKNIQKKPTDDDYYLDTGFAISSNIYGWISNADNTVIINIRPDIMISKCEEWNDDIPKDEELILIESKIWAKLGKNQAGNYKAFKEICNKVKMNNVSTVLISLDEIGNDEISENFDISLTWNKVIGSARELIKSHENLVEKGFFEEIFDLIETRLIPDREDFYENGKIDCKSVLQKMKYRIANYSPEKAQNAKKVDFYYDDLDSDPDYKEIIERYGITKDCEMSTLSIHTKNCIVEINCGISLNSRLVFWYEKVDKITEKYSKPEILSEIDLTQPYWKQSWYDTLYKVSEVITLENKE